MKKCFKCGNIIPNRVKIDGKIRILCSRKFCLACSPFGLHNTKDITSEPIKDSPLSCSEDDKKICPKCKENKNLSEYYKLRKLNPNRRKTHGTYCKKCTIDDAVGRQRKFKEDCINYKGGRCEICGYHKCNMALEFHHDDPTKKDFNLSHVNHTKFCDKIKEELNKCTLLCSNCHREEHEKRHRKDLNPHESD